MVYTEIERLKTKEEYRSDVFICIQKTYSLKKTKRELIGKLCTDFPTICEEIEKMYLACLSELARLTLEDIANSCYQRDMRFFELCKKPNWSSLEHELWNYIVKGNMLTLLKELVKESHGEPKEVIESRRTFVKTHISRWILQINRLLPYFSPQKAEKELLNAIDKLISSPDLPLSHATAWKKLFESSKGRISLCQLKALKWEHFENSKFHEFKSALDDVENTEFTLDTAEQLYNYLKNLLELTVCSKPTRSGTLLTISQKIMFLGSDSVSLLKFRKQYEDLFEIRVYASKRMVLGDKLKQKNFHGLNISLMTETLIVKGDCLIDLSGNGKDSSLRAKASSGLTGQDGRDGTDGEAGESSGNILIIAEQIINAEKLTVRVNGGDGAGGQNGGSGGDGKVGEGVTRSELDSLCVKYASLWNTFSGHFTDFKVASPFRCTFFENRSGWAKLRNSWVYGKFEDDDGRQIHYSFTGNNSWIHNIYDLYFVVYGAKGSSAGIGGANGLGGEGGNRGDVSIIQMSTGKFLKGIVVETSNGQDGQHGSPGKAGAPGQDGNDMAMIDRSKGNNDHKYYIGGGGKSKLSNDWYCNDGTNTRLNGYYKFDQNDNASYIHFAEVSIPTHAASKQTEQRTVSQRSNHSRAVAKQTIVREDVISEFNSKYCGEDVNFMVQEIQLNTDEIQEEETEEQGEQVQEEIMLLRTQVDDMTSHEINARQKQLKPEDVVDRIKMALVDTPDDEEMVELFRDVFSIPLDMSTIGMDLDTIVKSLESSEKSPHRIFWAGSNCTTFEKYMTGIKQDIKDKMDLSTVKLTMKTDLVPSTELKLDDRELVDVLPIPLTGQLELFHGQDYRQRLVGKLFKDVQAYGGDLELIKHMHHVNKNLHGFDKTADKHKDVMEPYAKSIDWSDLKAVKEHLKTFLTKKEIEHMQKKEEEVEKALAAKQEGVEVKGEGLMQGLNHAKETAQKGYNLIFGNSSRFKPIEKLTKKDEELQDILTSFNKFMKTRPKLEERLTLEYDRKGSPKPVGSTAMSFIHIYYYSEQFMKHNRFFYLCQKYYLEDSHLPTDWLDRDVDPYISFGKLIISLKDTYKPPGRLFEMHLLDNGLHSAAYRFLLAERQNINLQVFSDSGYARMKLVENWNPLADEKHLLYLGPTGSIMSIQADSSVRRLRMVVNSIQIGIDLKYAESPDLTPFVTSAVSSTVQEWSSALEAVAESTEFHRFLRRLFELRGFSYILQEFQFLFNTIIDLVGNYGMSLKQLISRFLDQHGNLLDLCLPIRIVASTRGACPPFDELVAILSKITDGSYRALLGCKVQEEEFNAADLESLVGMLSHAEQCFSELEQRSLKDWVDIARCQKWNDYEPLLKKYGTVGYFFVLLDSTERTKRESVELRSVIDELKEEKCIVSEKIISRLAYLLYNQEVTLTDAVYKMNVTVVLWLASCMSGREESQEISLLTEEKTQMVVIERLQKEYCWSKVFSNEERSLERLISLTINPQDTEEERTSRTKQMSEIEGMLRTNDKTNLCLRYLDEIDAALQKIRGISLRHTQKIAVLTSYLHGKNLLSQVNTGEGKSYIITSLAILKILMTNKVETVDVITSSNVLAQRDCEDMRPVYESFGIVAGHNCDEDLEKRKQAYKCQVVYGDIPRFERDYLLHHFYKRNVLGERQRDNVIVDEVDSMLLDNGSNMLYLSHNVAGLDLLEPLFVFLHKEVYSQARELNTQSLSAQLRRSVLWDMFGLITKADIQKLLLSEDENPLITVVWRHLNKHKIVDTEGILSEFDDKVLGEIAKDLIATCGATLARRVLAMIAMVKGRKQNICVPKYLNNFVLFHLNTFIDSALKGIFLKPNEEYVVDLDHSGRSSDLHPVVTIIDKGTGTDLTTSQWSAGLHQFLQLKHGCSVTPLSLKAVFISNVSYLKGYSKLYGFSGTLGSQEESKSLRELYQADIVRIPTWKPKIFNENAPVLSRESRQWIEDLYDECCDQFEADRSILLICKSIAEVKSIHEQLTELAWRKKTALRDVFEKAVLYQRDFNDFEFPGGLQPRNLIISTNLAGRGTDIKLSKELQDSGGLHVIITFLPDNARIEDQAYGRAARCGEPGSGQIIALVDENASAAKNIFQLKQFRDNAEQHRLRSLKQFYDYHIDVEESCLRRFQEFCWVAMKEINVATEGELPSQRRLVYFALLDEWSMWIDRQSDKIKRCESLASQAEKESIVFEAKTFLEKHPLPTNEEEVDWISSPQPLISSALISISQKEAERALRSLKKVIEQFPEFAPEADYYIGVINQQKVKMYKDHLKLTDQQIAEREKNMKEEEEREKQESDENENWIAQKWSSIKSSLNTSRLKVGDAMSYISAGIESANQWAGDMEDTTEEQITYDEEKVRLARRHFMSCRSGLYRRIWKKRQMAGIVSQLQQNSGMIVSRGYEEQVKQAVAVMEAFIGSIEDILGHTEDADDFLFTDEPAHKVTTRMRDYQAAGILSPALMTDNLTPELVLPVAQQHSLPPAALFTFLDCYVKSPLANRLDGYNIMEIHHLMGLPMPSKTGFWQSLREAECMLQQKTYIAIDKDQVEHFPGSGLKKATVNELDPFEIQLTDKKLDDFVLFEIDEKVVINRTLNTQIFDFMSTGGGHIELIGTLDPLAVQHVQILSQFCSVTESTLAIELGIAEEEASWIIGKLVEAHILEGVLVDNDEETEMTRVHPLLAQVTGDARTIATNCSFAYVQVGRFRFDMFPESIKQPLETVFARQFAYGYALKALKTSILNAADGKTSQHRILLPTEPYKDLYTDLKLFGVLHNCGITDVLTTIYKPKMVYESYLSKLLFDNGKALVSKVLPGKSSSFKSSDQCKAEAARECNYIPEEIYKKLEKKAPWMKVNPCKLRYTADYLRNKCVPAGVEARKMFCNGFLQLAHITKPNTWKWYLHVFLKLMAPLVFSGSCVAAIFFGPVTLVIGLVVIAAVGTTLYFLSMMEKNQKMFSENIHVEEQEEFKILLDSHSLQLDKGEADRKRVNRERKVEKRYAIALERLRRLVRSSSVVTMSDEVLSEEAKSLLADTFKSSVLLPMLKRWVDFLAVTIGKQLAIYITDDYDQEVEWEELFMPSTAVFATSVIADVNKTIRIEKLPIETLRTKIDEAEILFKTVLSEPETLASKVKENSLAVHLTELFIKHFDSCLDDSIDQHFWPAINQAQSVVAARTAPNGGELCLSPEQLQKRSMKYSEEKLALTNSSDFMSRDLCNIFLKICFQRPKPAVLQHMVKYNYSMSLHGALPVLKALLLILTELKKDCGSMTFQFVRDDETVLTVMASREKAVTICDVRLGVQGQCFLISDPQHNPQSAKLPVGLYQALLDIEEFATEFSLGPDAFQAALQEKIGITSPDFDAQWKIEAKWLKNEKLIPSVKL